MGRSRGRSKWGINDVLACARLFAQCLNVYQLHVSRCQWTYPHHYMDQRWLIIYLFPPPHLSCHYSWNCGGGISMGRAKLVSSKRFCPSHTATYFGINYNCMVTLYL